MSYDALLFVFDSTTFLKSQSRLDGNAIGLQDLKRLFKRMEQ
jgi:hypothetical protein